MHLCACSGLLLFAAGSFQAAWTVWSPFVSQIWLSHSSGTYQLMLMSLHLAAIVGGFVGALLVNRFQKKTIYVRDPISCLSICFHDGFPIRISTRAPSSCPSATSSSSPGTMKRGR